MAKRHFSLPRDFLLDIQRIVLLFWKCLKYGLFPFADYLPFMPYRRLALAVRVRLTLEEMGLTYLKLGQFLAMRYDVLPPEICRELSKLFDKIPAMPFAAAKEIVEASFGKPLATLFRHFEEEALAAASVAQVHRAETHGRERVAVKIQRAGLLPIFLADIRNLQRGAWLADACGLSGNLSATGMVNEFARWTLRELDFTQEGRTAERLRQTRLPCVLIPKVYWQLTTPQVLTIEFVDGISAYEVRRLLDEGGNALVRQRLPGFVVQNALDHFAFASLAQLFRSGFFHADAHPGNILFCPNNVVAFIDFGIFGELNEHERQAVRGMVYNLAVGNVHASFRFYAMQLIPTAETNWEVVRRECVATLRNWYNAVTDPTLPIEERHMAKYIGAMIEISRQNGLRFSLNYLLFWRAMNALNATAWQAEPHYDLINAVLRFFLADEENVANILFELATDVRWSLATAASLETAPRRLNTALDHLTDGAHAWAATVSGPAAEGRAPGMRWALIGILLLPITLLMSAQYLSWPVGAASAAVMVTLFVVRKGKQK